MEEIKENIVKQVDGKKKTEETNENRKVDGNGKKQKII